MAELERRRTAPRERIETFRPSEVVFTEDDQEVYVDREWATIDDPRDSAQAEPRKLEVSPDLSFTREGCGVHMLGMIQGDVELIGTILFWNHLPSAVNVYMGLEGSSATHSWYSADADLLLRIAESALDQQPE